VQTVSAANVIAVYRRGVAVPLLVVTGVVLLVFVAIGNGEPGVGVFVVAAWIMFVTPILIWRRAAAIFTSDSLLVRPCLGRTLRTPLKGVKRAYFHPGSTDEDGPTVRVELLIGGEINITVPEMEAVVHLLNKAAGKGLDAAQNKPLQPTAEKRGG